MKLKPLFIWFQVLSGGAKIDFTMYEPNKEHKPRFELTRIAEFEQYKLPINVSGDYRFCFINRYQGNYISVTFDYDMFAGDEEGDDAKQTELEKDVHKLYESMTDKFHKMVSTNRVVKRRLRDVL